jgi:hypothetical protein
MAIMFDKANAWLSRRIEENRARKQGRLSVDAFGLDIVRSSSRRRIAWGEIAEVTAIRKPAFLGDNLSLRIRCDDGALREVMEFDPAWRELIDAMQNHLPGSVPYAQWSLRTMIADPTTEVQIYRRT